MKKKIFRAAVIILITLILVILFCTKINKISLIENIREKIAKLGENLQTANDITIIDVTNLEDNGKLEHEHIFKTNYDETNHWEECTVCGEKLNEKTHSYTSSWTMGTANNCHKNNVYKSVCLCGYSKETTEGKKEHVWTKMYNTDSYFAYEICNNCNQSVSRNRHDCINKINGKRISCTNTGECSICHYNYSASHLYAQKSISGNDIICGNCKTYLGHINETYLKHISTENFEFYIDITLPSETIIESTDKFSYDNNVQLFNTIINNSGNRLIIKQNGKYNKHSETKSQTRISASCIINKIRTNIYLSADIIADIEPPTIQSITEENKNQLTEWSKTKPIIISGTENYCNTVSVKIIDDEENIVFKGTVGVLNNNYEVQCTPEIECDTNGRIFKIIVTDSLENKTEQEFTISKVDCIPPTPTSETEILGDWAKSKDFTFTATDYGIGNVQIAFNDVSDMKLAKVDEHIYSRDYTFTGDVYHEKELSVMYKDGLGNTSIQKITIDKLDNTAPTITNAQLHNNKLTITANDEHELLGEGSGVVKYRYLASEDKITNPKLTAENSLESTNAEITIEDIYKMKYIYIVAEDYVGNVSEVYEFEVPQLILTSSVNLNTADGKGEVILDWSSYDVTDKYFVVYRKKDNQTEWEPIVPLTQKLTGSTYTDRLGNDKAKPNVPAINITGDATNNNINITANSTDNGTNYKYYIEAYDSAETLISKSN